MRATDEAAWQQLCAQLGAPGETITSRRNTEFRAFVMAWTQEAEKLLDSPAFEAWRKHPELPVPALRWPSVAEALRSALAPTEQRLGRVSAHFLGQMLVVIIDHWYYGQELVGQLTPIELRLTQDSLLLKVAELEESAAQIQNERTTS